MSSNITNSIMLNSNKTNMGIKQEIDDNLKTFPVTSLMANPLTKV
jgi:hypothetical protein